MNVTFDGNIHLLKKTTRMSSLLTKRLITISGYFVSMVLLLIVTMTAQKAIIQSPIPLDFENLLGLSLEAYVFLSSIVAGFLFLFYLTYLFTVYIQRWEISPGWRVAGILGSSLLCYLLLELIPGGPPARTASLSLASFILIAELFINPARKSLTYLITWTIILSAFLAMIFFNAYIQYDSKNRKHIASSLYHEIQETHVNQIDKTQNALLKNKVFEQILSVPYPFKIHREEFRQISKDIFEENEKNKYIFNAYDRTGTPMLYETYTPLSYYNDFIKRSFQLDDNTYYDPIKAIYLKKWEYDAPHHQNSPFTIYLEQFSANTNEKYADFLAITNNQSSKFNYVFYNNGDLKSFSSPHFVQEEDQEIKLGKGESKMVVQNGNSDLYYGIDDQNMIKLSRNSAKLIKPISLFSFIFIFIAGLIGMVSLVNSQLHWLPYSFSLEFQKGSTLRNKLQLSIIGLTILSFLIIGFVTIFYFYRLSKQYDQEVLHEKTKALAIDISAKTKHMAEIDHMVNSLSSSLSTITSKHHNDINVYNPSGTLLVSSIPKSFEMNQTPTSLEPSIIKSFEQNAHQIKLNTATNFSNEFQKSYFAILNNEGELSLLVESLNPSNIKAYSKVSDFVGTLLNVYVFLFLIAGAIGLVVSNSITKPLSKLGEKLKKFKLGFRNEPLEWKSQDELGQLINTYNEMVNKLDDSAKVLAKTERDLAWREMAKQVAHEIKNPLTPMKLNIQYLLKAIERNPEDAQVMISKVSNTLIEQIDNLTGIANAFSNFGKMPQAENEKINLNEVVEAVHQLFRKRNDIEFNMYQPIDDIFVYADKNHMIRILNNLIKNSIQAIPVTKKGSITIKLYKSDKSAIIEVKDNGVGISDEMKDKVFSPYFTTKSSGTGLGLAICSNMVESFNGRLYFESQSGEGTVFFIEIPLLHITDNFEEIETILLEHK